jgi:hypothetical protein
MTIAPGPGLSTGDVPHLRVPFAIGGFGTAETVQQGTNTELIQNVGMLVGTRPGTRHLIPSYGTVDPTFGVLNVKDLALATQKWEPRAAINVITMPGGEEVITVQVAGGTP